MHKNFNVFLWLYDVKLSFANWLYKQPVFSVILINSRIKRIIPMLKHSTARAQSYCRVCVPKEERKIKKSTPWMKKKGVFQYKVFSTLLNMM